MDLDMSQVRRLSSNCSTTTATTTSTATAAIAAYYEPSLGFDSLEAEALVHNMPNTIICRERQVRLHLVNHPPPLFRIPLKRSQEREPKRINPSRNIRVQLCQSRDQLDRFHTEA